MDLAHTIVAMVGDKIARVECRTCKKPHAYKAPKGIDTPVAKPKKSSSKTQSRSAKVSIEDQWHELMLTHKNSPLQKYGIRQTFSAGDRLKHVKFGDGVVTKTIHPDKIEVVFQNDLKVLIHARD
tara:strand:- start:5246 stop:5620 length:375 start_codon:yes stop_codon:yes gene_type:complete